MVFTVKDAEVVTNAVTHIKYNAFQLRNSV